jgi:predicted amidohydrolase YtcJ
MRQPAADRRCVARFGTVLSGGFMAARLTAYLVVAIVGVTFIAGLIVGAQRDDSDGPVDLIVRNAVVYTADHRGTMAEAVAIRGNQILRVGSDREIARLERPQTVVVDARGGTVLPGFNDSRVSLVDGGLALAMLDLADASGVADIQERVASWSAAHPSAPWIVGRGWSQSHFKNGHPSPQQLDAVVPDRPVLLHGADGDSIWVNSKALQLANITRHSTDPEGGAILKEARTAAPGGVLRGRARSLVTALVPAPSIEHRAAAVRAAMAHANELGVTSVQSIDDTPETLQMYAALRRAGELTLRVYAGLHLARPLAEGDLAALKATAERYPDDPLFKAGALTIALDGSVGERAAAMLEPYDGTADAGETSLSPDDLNRTARLADAAGWQIVVDANGDRAVRLALNAYAHAVRSNQPPGRGRRHRIDSIAFAGPAELERFEPLGVVASMQPQDATAPGVDAWEKQVGAARAARAFPVQDVAGHAKLLLGTAWPEHDLNPLMTLDAAVNTNREADPTERPTAPAAPLELKAAIDAYTSRPAWASFDDQRKGSISAGMLADLVVLTDDVFAAPGKLRSTSVAFTIFDGRIVYRRTARAETEPAPSFQH